MLTFALAGAYIAYTTAVFPAPIYHSSPEYQLSAAFDIPANNLTGIEKSFVVNMLDNPNVLAIKLAKIEQSFVASTTALLPVADQLDLTPAILAKHHYAECVQGSEAVLPRVGNERDSLDDYVQQGVRLYCVLQHGRVLSELLVRANFALFTTWNVPSNVAFNLLVDIYHLLGRFADDPVSSFPVAIDLHGIVRTECPGSWPRVLKIVGISSPCQQQLMMPEQGGAALLELYKHLRYLLVFWRSMLNGPGTERSRVLRVAGQNHEAEMNWDAEAAQQRMDMRREEKAAQQKEAAGMSARMKEMTAQLRTLFNPSGRAAIGR